MRRLLPFWSPLTFLFVIGTAWFALAMLPVSMWLDARRVDFAPAHVGASPKMVLDRSVNRPFEAEWTVAIRRWDGGWVPFCTANGSQPYRPDGKLPKDADLNWWTWGKCHPLPAGKYEVIAVWEIQTPWPLPNKRAELKSNVFEVTE